MEDGLAINGRPILYRPFLFLASFNRKKTAISDNPNLPSLPFALLLPLSGGVDLSIKQEPVQSYFFVIKRLMERQKCRKSVALPFYPHFQIL